MRNDEFAPFYVGKSSRILGRIADYQKANYSARTDFVVGETVKYFMDMKQDVKIAFMISENPDRDEGHWIDEARVRGYVLLNGFNLGTNEENEARGKVRRNAIKILKNLQRSS